MSSSTRVMYVSDTRISVDHCQPRVLLPNVFDEHAERHCNTGYHSCSVATYSLTHFLRRLDHATSESSFCRLTTLYPYRSRTKLNGTLRGWAISEAEQQLGIFNVILGIFGLVSREFKKRRVETLRVSFAAWLCEMLSWQMFRFGRFVYISKSCKFFLFTATVNRSRLSCRFVAAVTWQRVMERA